MTGLNDLFRCVDCDLIFCEPKEYSETYEAYGRPIIHRYFACPNCAGAFVEQGESDESEE